VVKANYDNVEEYLKSVQQDIVVPVNTVHDEINYGVEIFLIKPILKKIIEKFTAKSLVDGFGYPYMNFLFDTEYNKDTGAFTGEGFEGVDSFYPYTYPLHHEEKVARDKWKKVLSKFQKNTKDDKSITLKYGCIEGVDLTKYHTKNGYILFVEKDGKKYRYKHQVKKKILKVCKNSKTGTNKIKG